MGSPDALQIDGVGGATTTTSKVAVLSRSREPGIDVDFVFAQVSVTTAVVDWGPSCGNILAGVGPAVVEMRLMDAETKVRVRLVNSGGFVEAVVQTPSGQVTYEGDAAIDGVPGTAAPVELNYFHVMGSKMGKLLPTGRLRDLIDGVEVTCINCAMQCRSSSPALPRWGRRGTSRSWNSIWTWVSSAALQAKGWDWATSLVAAPAQVVGAHTHHVIVLEHPSGGIPLVLKATQQPDSPPELGILDVHSAGAIRTARLLFTGMVRVPSTVGLESFIQPDEYRHMSDQFSQLFRPRQKPLQLRGKSLPSSPRVRHSSRAAFRVTFASPRASDMPALLVPAMAAPAVRCAHQVAVGSVCLSPGGFL